MKYRTRIYYTEEQKTLMWDRWQKGESLSSIARLFDRRHSPCWYPGRSETSRRAEAIYATTRVPRGAQEDRRVLSRRVTL